MKLRCAVVGLGRGRMFVDMLNAIDGCSVVAVCDSNPAMLGEFSGLECFTDCERMLDEKLDVVAIISPGPVHTGQTLAALRRGIHVLCETPCVYSIEEAQAVVKEVEKTGLKYMLAENYIWQGWCEALREIAERGDFGEIVYAEGDYTHDCRDFMLYDENGLVPYAKRAEHPNAQKTWRATHLPPIQYCSHTLGPLLSLMNDRVVNAYCIGIAGRAAPDLVPTDLESALLQTEKGAAIRLTNGFSVAHPMALYYNIVGTRGSAKLLSGGGMIGQWWSEAQEGHHGWQQFDDDFHNRADGLSDVEVMLREYIESIRSDTKPPIDVHESMDMTLPGIIAHQSGLQGGVKLDVPNSRDW